ncbi:MAG: hypothetical protein ABW168_26425, partial [Sedimenticola sp.]
TSTLSQKAVSAEKACKMLQIRTSRHQRHDAGATGNTPPRPNGTRNLATRRPPQILDHHKQVPVANSSTDTSRTQTVFCETKQYTLRKQNALQKKLAGCLREHLSVELKPGKNLILKLSTAAYELAKYITIDALQIDCLSSFVSSEEVAVDQNGDSVELRLKLVNKKRDGLPGSQTKLTINFYNTTSNIMVNGSKVDLFIDNILPILNSQLEQHCSILDVANSHIGSTINHAVQNTGVLPSKVQESQEIPTTSTEVAIVIPTANQTEENSAPEFICPVCDLEAGSETIACEECNDWFHFQCAGLSNEDVKKIRGNSPFICKCCNDNVLYGPTQTNTALQPILPTQSGTGDSHLPSSPVQRIPTRTTPEHPSLSQSSSSLHHERPSTEVITTDTDCQSTPSTTSGYNSSPRLQPPNVNTYSRTNHIVKDNINLCNLELPTESTTTPILTTNKSTKRAKTASSGASKQSKENTSLDSDQATYIVALERKMNSLQKTIDTLLKKDNIDPVGNSPTEQVTNTTYQPVHNTIDIEKLRQLEAQTFDARIRQLEFGMMQNMCAFTNNTSQLHLQLQHQATMIQALQNQQHISSLHNMNSHTNFNHGHYGYPNQPTMYSHGFHPGAPITPNLHVQQPPYAQMQCGPMFHPMQHVQKQHHTEHANKMNNQMPGSTQNAPNYRNRPIMKRNPSQQQRPQPNGGRHMVYGRNRTANPTYRTNGLTNLAPDQNPNTTGTMIDLTVTPDRSSLPKTPNHAQHVEPHSCTQNNNNNNIEYTAVDVTITATKVISEQESTDPNSNVTSTDMLDEPLNTQPTDGVNNVRTQEGTPELKRNQQSFLCIPSLSHEPPDSLINLVTESTRI